MYKQPVLKRRWVRGSAVVAATALSLAIAAPAFATPLAGVKDVAVNKTDDYVVDVTFEGNVKGRITFLDDGIFRYNVDPSGQFSAYAQPRSSAHVARIQAQPDASDAYTHPKASVTERDGAFVITSGSTTISLDRKTAKMTVKSGDKVVLEEQSALDLNRGNTTQTLVKHEGENFFGGGTQNGRFIHTGNSIHIANESSWTDGGVASPNPFYWSDKGYGVLRNTFFDGTYDFGKTTNDVVAAHDENEFDAYYFVADASKGVSTAPVAQQILQQYFKVTGNPVLLPEYAFYVGHLNAYNRDMWSETARSGYKAWQVKGSDPATDPSAGTTKWEKGGTGVEMQAGSTVESLNGTPATVQTSKIPQGVKTDERFSARAKMDEYIDNDMPLGYFLPNDGYGCGYGQNGYNMTGGVLANGKSSPERLAAVEANVQNLKEFSDYAKSKGVATGLWTQSNLTPDSNATTKWHTLRDFSSEVSKGGVTTLKTDVAWVGYGYSFGLNGTKTAYDIVTEQAKFRPNIITLDGWAGSQRFAGIWTGDQVGGNWEYIRFHVPTFIGQSLSGNPNIGSDMDGIWGGDPVIATRDYQWKSFAPLMLDMDGWGTYAKAPQTHGDPYTGISRMYLKLKSQLLPYIYTTAASAANIDTGNGDAGLPIVRAILLSDNSAYANSTATQYEYTLGEDFLIAPIYQNTDGTGGKVGEGDDVRNNIYLPGDEDTIWIDYFTGAQYRGGQVLDNFAAPLWKLPVFVKANAIVPMYEPNNSPQKIDRTVRNVEFFATSGENSYTLFEDTGTYVENKTDTSDKEYGKQGKISYGDHVSATFTSKVAGDTATFTAKKSTGTYAGYKKDRTTTFVVNVSEQPSKIVAKNGDAALKEKKVGTQAEFDAAQPAAGECVVFYNAQPNLNYGASTDAPEAVKAEGFSQTQIITTPKLYVKFATTDVQANDQTLVLTGFKNDGRLSSNEVDAKLAVPTVRAPQDLLTPTSYTLSWDKVEGATSYEFMIDGMLHSVPASDLMQFTVADQEYHSTHKVKIRQRAASGVSNWSEELSVTTLEDPWRNVPVAKNTTWTGTIYGNHVVDLAFDKQFQSGDGGFHSGGNDMGKQLTLDYGQAYKFTTLVYHPRSDAGNGTVTKMRIETSMDGVHWKSQELDWAQNAEAKEVELNTSARYIRMTPLKAVGNFFSASEIVISKEDDTEAFEVGSIAGDGAVTDADFSQLTGNFKGRENRAPYVEQWTHVAGQNADFNFNEAYDVYDMSFTMSKLDGGTTKDGKVSGGIVVIPSKNKVKAGETIDVSVYANDAANVNAVGSLVHFDGKMFSYVGDSLAQGQQLAEMVDLSAVTTDFADGQQSVNIAYANKGDKKLFAGSAPVASFKLKALKDGEVALPSTSWLIGPACDAVENVDTGNVELPEKPAPAVQELGMDAFSKMTITNDVLTEDDGTNVNKMIQFLGWSGLFNGNENSNDFEFKWDIVNNHINGKLPEYVKLPSTLTFTLKQPTELGVVEVFNRLGGNGTVTNIEAVIAYEDGTTKEFKGGEFAKRQDVYTFRADAGKKVASVSIKPLSCEGVPAQGYEGEDAKNRMLTLREINFKTPAVAASVDAVELGDNAKTLYVGDVDTIKATVLPADNAYPYYTAESSKPEVASVTRVRVGDEVVNYIRANKVGKATITVTSALDETKSATYELTVREGLNTAELDEAIERAGAYDKSVYTPDSYKRLQDVVAQAQALLDSNEITEEQVHEYAVKIDEAIAALKLIPIDFDSHFNKDTSSGVFIIKASSSASESPFRNALDYNEDTYWHSNYNDRDELPDYLIFNLGKEHTLTDIAFKTRQDGGTNGDIFEAKVYVGNTVSSLDGDGKGTLLGTFTFDNNGEVLTNRQAWQQMSFAPTATRFVKIEATKAGGEKKNAYASVAEVRFYDKRTPAAANVAALDALVKQYEAEGLVADQYTEATWVPYAQAMKDAKALLANPPAADQQAVVDALVKDLTEKHDALAKKPAPAPQVDKAALEAAVEEARALKAEDYKTMTWHPFAAALKSAEKVLADAKADQKAVDAAAKALADARAGLKPVEKVAFVDVDEDTSHRAEVEWLAANGVSKGWPTADGAFEFRPYATVKRADMAAFLYRLAGEPAFDAKDVAFADVDEKTPHRDAILWLASEGISTGYEGEGGRAEFRPYAEITRCDMAAFLYRMAGEPEFEAKDAFSDIARDTPHREAVLWLAASGVSTGWTAEDGTKTFRPYDQIVRCDMAAFLQRMAEKDLVDLK
uniref:discoidin domain-containing protein n=1 Tax=Collinsella sp. BA40 TaxID=2560852 RepID=UPI0016508079|nr:discoidin domain-containing protein [Collinsella sp. BA40]